MPRPSSCLSSGGTGERRLACGDRRSPLVGATARGLPDQTAVVLRVRGGCVEWCVARIRVGWLYIAGARGGDMSLPECSGHAANVDERLQREGTGCSVNAGACPRSRTSTGGGLRWGQAHARTVPFWPRLDRACCGGSGVGERQGGVMGDGSRVVARCGSRRRALACTRAKQNAKRQPERVETLPGAVSSRGHQAGMVKTTPRSGQTLSTRSTVQCLV